MLGGVAAAVRLAAARETDRDAMWCGGVRCGRAGCAMDATDATYSRITKGRLEHAALDVDSRNEEMMDKRRRDCASQA